MRVSIGIFVALLVLSGPAWAQDAADPDEDYVLQKAREKLAGQESPAESADSTTAPASAAQPASPSQPVQSSPTITIIINGGTRPGRGAQQSDDRASNYPYFPFVVGFVPGISFPFGTYDTSVSVAAIGAMTGSVYGVQGASVFSIALGDVRGAQGSGVFNTVEGTVQGAQGAGVFNIAGNAEAIQGAGVFNIAGDVHGGQAAGVFNIAENVRGVQAAGLFNIAEDMRGVQAAGIFNVAGDANGVMIGLVNIADSLDGVAIGLVNVIGNGIHDINIDYQFDTGMAYATYRSGTPFLYASFYTGQPASEIARTSEGATFGAGLGHRFRFLFLTADVEACWESPLDAEYLAAAGRALFTEDWSAPIWLEPYPKSFASLKATFGFGKRKGFGPYVGIKTDFGIEGVGGIPEWLRSAFGSPEPYAFELFGREVVAWPKIFAGIKF